MTGLASVRQRWQTFSFTVALCFCHTPWRTGPQTITAELTNPSRQLLAPSFPAWLVWLSTLTPQPLCPMPRAPLASDLPCVSRCLAWPCALLSFVFSPLSPLFAPCFLFLVLSPHHSLLSLQPKGSGHRLCPQSWSLAPYWHKLLQAQLYWGPLEQGGERIADATHNSGHSSVFVLGSRHGFRVMPRHHCLSPRPCAPRCHAGKAQLGGFGAVAGLYWEQSLIAGSSGHAPSQIHPQRCDVIACLTLAISSAECGLEVTSKGFQGRLENMTWCLGGSVRQLRLGRSSPGIPHSQDVAHCRHHVPYVPHKAGVPPSHSLLGTAYLSTAGAEVTERSCSAWHFWPELFLLLWGSCAHGRPWHAEGCPTCCCTCLLLTFVGGPSCSCMQGRFSLIVAPALADGTSGSAKPRTAYLKYPGHQAGPAPDSRSASASGASSYSPVCIGSKWHEETAFYQLHRVGVSCRLLVGHAVVSLMPSQ